MLDQSSKGLISVSVKSLELVTPLPSSSFEHKHANGKVPIYLIFSILILKYPLLLQSTVKHSKMTRGLCEPEATLLWQTLLVMAPQPPVPSRMGDTQQLPSKLGEGDLAAHSWPEWTIHPF